MNYNKPLPPLSLQDLNERTVFNERDTENPEIRDMFKALGIIESFGTGIGEAKRALEANQSPELYYKIFTPSDNVTSVVIPVCEKYLEVKQGTNSKDLGIDVGIVSESQAIKSRILESRYSSETKRKMISLYEVIGTEEVCGKTGQKPANPRPSLGPIWQVRTKVRHSQAQPWAHGLFQSKSPPLPGPALGPFKHRKCKNPPSRERRGAES